MERSLVMKGKPLLRSILDAFEEGVCLLDEAGAVRCMNAAAEELIGYRQEELFGRPFLPNVKITQGGDDPGSDAHDRSHIPSWNAVQFLCKDGRVWEALCAIWPLGQDGEGLTLLKFRKRAREPIRDLTLQDIKPKLDAIFDTVPDGLIVISEVGDIQLFSSSAEKLFGYHQEEALGHNVKMLMPAPYREAHDGYLATYRNTGVKKIIGVGREVSGRRKDGVVFPMYISIGEMWLDGRRFFVAVTHDLTKLKRAEEQLLTLSTAMDQSPSAVMISEREGRIEYVNRRFTRLTGYDAAELIGQNPRLLRSPDTSENRIASCGRHSRQVANGAAKSRIARRPANFIGRSKPLRRCVMRGARSLTTWRSNRTLPSRNETRRRSPKAKSDFVR